MTDQAAGTSPRRSSTHSVLGLSATTIALPLSAVVTGPILARSLGPDDRGVLAAVLAPSLFAAALFVLGVPSALTFYVAKGQLSYRTALKYAALLGGLTGLIAAVTVFVTAPVLLERVPRYIPILRMTAITLIPAGIAAAIRGVQQGRGEFRLVNRERWASIVLRVSFILTLSCIGIVSVDTAAWATILSAFVGSIFLLSKKREKEVSDNSSATQVGMPPVLRYSGLVAIGALSGTVLMRLDQTLMPVLTSVREIGFYAVAVSVAELPLFASIAVRDVVLTASTQKSDPNLVAIASRLVLIVQSILAAISAIALPLLVPIVFGPDFAEAVPAMLILLAAGVLGSAGTVLNQGLLSLNAPAARSITQGVSAVLSIVTLLVLAPAWGSVGAAISSTIAYAASSLLNAVVFARKAELRITDCLLPRVTDLSELGRLMREFTK